MSFLLLKMKVFFPIVHQLLKRKETVDGRKENSFLKKKAFPVINCWPADKEKRKSGQRWQERYGGWQLLFFIHLLFANSGWRKRNAVSICGLIPFITIKRNRGNQSLIVKGIVLQDPQMDRQLMVKKCSLRLTEAFPGDLDHENDSLDHFHHPDPLLWATPGLLTSPAHSSRISGSVDERIMAVKRVPSSSSFFSLVKRWANDLLMSHRLKEKKRRDSGTLLPMESSLVNVSLLSISFLFFYILIDKKRETWEDSFPFSLYLIVKDLKSRSNRKWKHGKIM